MKVSEQAKRIVNAINNVCAKKPTIEVRHNLENDTEYILIYYDKEPK